MWERGRRRQAGARRRADRRNVNFELRKKYCFASSCLCFAQSTMAAALTLSLRWLLRLTTHTGDGEWRLAAGTAHSRRPVLRCHYDGCRGLRPTPAMADGGWPPGRRTAADRFRRRLAPTVGATNGSDPSRVRACPSLDTLETSRFLTKSPNPLKNNGLFGKNGKKAVYRSTDRDLFV